MFSITSMLSRSRPAPSRLDLATLKCADQPQPFGRRTRQSAADDRLYFAVRSFGFSAARQILQYAFADDRGNVVMSYLAQAETPCLGGPELTEDMPVQPLDPAALDFVMSKVCHGSNLVAFGRVLQAGLLPSETVKVAGSIDCAWRRFLKIGRQRRLSFDRHQPLTLSDALAAAGLPSLESADAAMRALAIRDLWMWMDRMDLEQEAH